MNTAENLKGKKERQGMFPFEKTELLDKLDKEMSILVIRHKFGLNKSIIFYVKKNGKKISETITARALMSTIP